MPSRVVTRPLASALPRALVAVRPLGLPGRDSLAAERVVPVVVERVVPAADAPRSGAERSDARGAALPAVCRSEDATPPIVRPLPATARRSALDTVRRLSLPRET